MAAVAHGGLLSVATLACIAELGDKTYFLAMIFAVWCPLNGLRSGAGALSEQLLATTGALAALLVRAILVAVGLRISLYADRSVDAVVTSMLVAFAFKACIDFRRADYHGSSLTVSKGSNWASACSAAPARSEAQSKAVDSHCIETRHPLPAGGFLGNFKAYEPADHETAHTSGGDEKNPFADAPVASQEAWSAGYGGVDTLKGPSGAQWSRHSGPQEDPARLLASFMLPFVSIFLAESTDKSLSVLGNSLVGGAVVEVLLGSAIGYFVAILTAALFGFLLERQVAESQLLFTATCVFFAMALVTGSTAIMRAEFPTATTAAGLRDQTSAEPAQTIASAAAALLQR